MFLLGFNGKFEFTLYPISLSKMVDHHGFLTEKRLKNGIINYLFSSSNGIHTKKQAYPKLFPIHILTMSLKS
jgi:hypothetical protein